MKPVTPFLDIHTVNGPLIVPKPFSDTTVILFAPKKLGSLADCC